MRRISWQLFTSCSSSISSLFFLLILVVIFTVNDDITNRRSATSTDLLENNPKSFTRICSECQVRLITSTKEVTFLLLCVYLLAE